MCTALALTDCHRGIIVAIASRDSNPGADFFGFRRRGVWISARYCVRTHNEMSGFIIETKEGIKEAFVYERPLNDHTMHAVTEYALATYGATARFRPMSNEEERAFARHSESYFTDNSRGSP
ncbi:MAG TPA: hypothetical protein VE863_03490 [Pyrinomonadaceae bacterium]|jgi:hypothetical protein|nr:hypothetical protein [Pyrinomonadaceae bacterium]